MKQYKWSQLLTVILFCGFLGIMAVLWLVLPEKNFSELEKRYLAEPPEFTAEQLFSGAWGNQAETYLADHLPGRDFFVGVNAYFDWITGRQQTKDIRTDRGYLLEAPRQPDEAAIRRNLGAVNAFAQKLQRPVDLMIIPSAGWAVGNPQYRDGEILEKIRQTAGENVTPVELTELFTPDCFYRTDHHWTSLGAYRAYCAYAEHLGLEPRRDFSVELQGNFRGSTYSRSGLWLTPGESLELWQGSDLLTVENGEDPEAHAGVFYRENLQKLDKYTVFLGGNHSLVTIRNPEKTGKLLVIRDSYSNCLGCFLGESFGQVTMVDLRYYKKPVSLLVEQEQFDHVLVCYGLGNFLSDQNLVFLNR